MSKSVVLVVNRDEERVTIGELLRDEGFTVYEAQTGKEAICMLEDYICDLVWSDIQLADMHAWTMLTKIKEIKPVAKTPMIVLADDSIASPLENVTLVIRPVAIASLRQLIREL